MAPKIATWPSLGNPALEYKKEYENFLTNKKKMHALLFIPKSHKNTQSEGVKLSIFCLKKKSPFYVPYFSMSK